MSVPLEIARRAKKEAARVAFFFAPDGCPRLSNAAIGEFADAFSGRAATHLANRETRIGGRF